LKKKNTLLYSFSTVSEHPVLGNLIPPLADGFGTRPNVNVYSSFPQYHLTSAEKNKGKRNDNGKHKMKQRKHRTRKNKKGKIGDRKCNRRQRE
jgi:hypothetical protein